MFLTLYLINYANSDIDKYLWIRAAIVGLWSSATTSAGAISFQKYQQTLDAVMNQETDEREALSVLVLPAIVFGFLSFPLSYLLTIIFRMKAYFDLEQLLIGGILLLLSAGIMSLFIAIFFVLTNDAIIYEQLIDIPIVLLSGVFGFPTGFEWLGTVTRWLIPVTGPIRILMNGISGIDFIATIVSTMVWALVAWLIASKLIQLSKKTGRLGEV